MELADAISRVFQGTALDGHKFIGVGVPDSDEVVVAVKIKPDELMSCWQAARDKLDKTQRWPIVSTFFSPPGMLGSLKKSVEEELLDRFPFEDDETGEALSPKTILQRADIVDVDAFLQGIAVEMNAYFEDDDELVEYVLDECVQAVGRRPDDSELDNRVTVQTHRIEHWAYQQLLVAGMPPNPEEGRPPWFEAHETENVMLLFMPTPNAWDSLAYVSWYGAEVNQAANVIAVARRWEQKYGAELVAHYGTILQCLASRPPSEPMDAFQLAVEHDLIAPCTMALSGIDVRQYAQGLLNYDRWFLHERP